MSQARIYQQRFAARKGKTISCEKCKDPIPKGATYRSFQVGFRSRYTHVRCMKASCTPRPSELESSMLAEVYSAQEGAQDELTALENGDPGEDASDIKSVVESCGEGIRGVADQYREAAEAMGSAGEGSDNEERADTLETAADELEGWDPDDDEPDFDGCANEKHEAMGPVPEDVLERGSADCDECGTIRSEWWMAQIDAAREMVDGIELP